MYKVFISTGVVFVRVPSIVNDFGSTQVTVLLFIVQLVTLQSMVMVNLMFSTQQKLHMINVNNVLQLFYWVRSPLEPLLYANLATKEKRKKLIKEWEMGVALNFFK